MNALNEIQHIREKNKKRHRRHEKHVALVNSCPQVIALGPLAFVLAIESRIVEFSDKLAEEQIREIEETFEDG